MVLMLVLSRLKIDLDARLSEGRLLELGELEEIVRYCHLTVGYLASEEVELPRGSAKVIRLERARMRSERASASSAVDADTAAIRIRYIRDYINWKATARLLRIGPQDKLYSGLKTANEIVARVLNERIPISSGRNSLFQREGMSAGDLAKLLSMTEPDSLDNPWSGDHARLRNALIVRWLLGLGLRRGELLGVRISNINFLSNEVLVARRADDPEDPRRNQPNTKTRDRLVPMDERLAVLTRRYITGERRAIVGARRHDFLMVANGTGAPLTLEALNKIFERLRARTPDLPRELSPHICRHTFNESLSIDFDRQGISEETERKIRSHLNGWSPTSDTASVYTRRHIREKAREASLGMQGRMLNRKAK